MIKHTHQRATREKDIRAIGAKILASKRFGKARTVPHHFDYDVAAHSLDATECALTICRWLNCHGANVCEKDVVEAALLHDIGMTEDEVFQSPPSEKAYTHPVESARIAREEYGANNVELDAILYHMWPIGHTPPHHLVGWILVAADKWSSIRETNDYAIRAIARRFARTRSSRA